MSHAQGGIHILLRLFLKILRGKKSACNKHTEKSRQSC